MARYCPVLKETVTYMVCLECEEKLCKQLDRQENKEDKESKEE